MEDYHNEDDAKGKYTQVYLCLFGEFDLTPIEGLLVSEIKTLSKQRGYCWASEKSFGRWFNVSLPTIIKAIQKLIKLELVECLGRTPEKTLKLKVTDVVENCFFESKKFLEERRNL
jgi:hypothetical protein